MTADPRTPSQVAEDEAREAHEAIENARGFCSPGSPMFVAIDKIGQHHARALAAARWAQHDADHDEMRSPGVIIGTCTTCDRLRREWEESR